MRRALRPCNFALAFPLLLGTVRVALGASYLPVPDADLARSAPVIVHARVIDQLVRIETRNGKDYPFTITTLQTLEGVKGSAPEVFAVRLPGGLVGGIAWHLPGTPVFSGDSEVILFLAPWQSAGEPVATFNLTEFGLSKFDVVEDAAGRRFAVRPTFDRETDDILAGRAGAASTAAAGGAGELRDAESLLCALRAVAAGSEATPIQYAAPRGALQRGGASPLWVNIGGPEPGNCGSVPCLFRWFWDTGESPNGVVYVTGSQTNLTDGSDGRTHVQNTVDKWHGVAGSDVRYSGIASSTAPEPAGAAPETILANNVNVKLDVTTSDDGSSWTTPLTCSLGLLGLGGPDPSPAAKGPFKGDGNYYAIRSATVQMRKNTCNSGYTAAVFRSAVLHEVGHTLGLGHPDQGQSRHSTTTSADWNSAVMRSLIPNSLPDTPQKDDIQAIQSTTPAPEALPAHPTRRPSAPTATASRFRSSGRLSPRRLRRLSPPGRPGPGRPWP
jgi:hypothetical protein